MTGKNIRKSPFLLSLAVSLAAFVYYAGNMATYAVPNQWSAALLSIRGDNSFRPLSHPLWQFIMSVVGDLPGSGMLFAANFFSALCGAVAVGLGFLVGYHFRQPASRLFNTYEQSRLENSRWISGLITAGFMAASTPLFVVSTSAHPLALDICLLLGATWCTLLYRDHPANRFWFAFALLFGVGIAEYSTFILMAPVFLLWWFWLFWTLKTFRVAPMLGGLGLLLAGLSIGFIFCAQYAHSAAAGWREFDGFWMVCRYFLLDHYMQLRFSVPRLGWLMVLFTTIVPALYIFWGGHEDAEDIYSKIGLYLFRVVLLALAVIILFNLPGSPWKIVGANTPLVAPCTIAALWTGQLIALLATSINPPGRMRKQAPQASLTYGRNSGCRPDTSGFRVQAPTRAALKRKQLKSLKPPWNLFSVIARSSVSPARRRNSCVRTWRHWHTS